jgi:hypothetical protein
MAKEITRRKAMGIAAGAAITAIPGGKWIFALNGHGTIVKAAVQDETDWSPLVIDSGRIRALAAICEAIIPRTDTPGALDARVHEYIDLSLSIESDEIRKNFLDSLAWFNGYSVRICGEGLATASPEQLTEVLATVSDAADSHPDNVDKGVAFFKDVKRRTIFAYYTSEQGRVDLGLPARVSMSERFRGCTHRGGHQ